MIGHEPGRPLVGRDGELAVLRDHGRAALRSRRAVLVSGGPGVGKSAVCRQTVAALPAGFRDRVEVGCTPAVAGEPLAAVRLACRGLDLARWRPQLERVIARWPEVTTLLPGIPGIPGAGSGTPPGVHRARLAAGVRELLALCGPLALFVDDVHLADEATRDVLCRVLLHTADGPLFVLLAGRTDGDRLRAELPQWRRCPDFAELPLPSLAPTEVEVLLQRAGVPDGPRAWVIDRAAGNPLLALDLASLATDSHRPSLVEDVVTDTLSRLTEPGRGVVLAAAPSDDAPSVDVLASVLGWSEEVFDQGLDDALDRHVLELDRMEHIRFAEPAVRSAVLGLMSGAECRWLHRRYAEVLGVDPAAARHWVAAGATDRAAETYLDAAREVLATAPGEALELARSAIEHAVALPAAGRVGGWITVAQAADAAGRHDEAVTAWRAARGAGHGDAPPAALLCTIAEGFADCAALDAADEAALAGLAAADAMDGASVAAARALATAVRAWVLALRHEPTSALEVARAALRLAGGGAVEVRLRVEIATAAARFDLGDVAETVASLARVAHEAAAADLPELACRAIAAVARCRLRCGDPDAAAREAERGIRLAGYTRLPRAERRLRALLGRADPNSEGAQGEGESAPEASPPDGCPPDELYVAALRTGRRLSVADALTMVERLLIACPADLCDDAELLYARLLLAAERPDAASAVLHGWLERTGPWWRDVQVPLVCALAVCASMGASTGASTGTSAAEQSRQPYDFAQLAAAALERITRHLGDPPAGAAAGVALLGCLLSPTTRPADWHRAVEIFATAGDGLLAAQVAIWGGTAMLAAGLRDAGEELLRAGLGSAATSGFAPLVAEARRIAHRHDVPLRHAGVPPLTADERALLALLAEGCDNAEIARRLFVSPRTAGARVSRLLRTLGVAHRTHVGAFAAELLGDTDSRHGH